MVVALVALRALVPAGFMAAPGRAGPELVFCDTAATHHHHVREHATVDASCPFAQSAAPSPPPALPALAAAIVPHVFERLAASAQTALVFGPPRQQSPRGPPESA